METCLHTCSPLVGPESFSQVRIFLDENDDSSKADPGQGWERGIGRRKVTGLNPLCWSIVRSSSPSSITGAVAKRASQLLCRL